MKILNNKKYKFHCYECSSDILFSKEDCLVDRTYGDFWLNCPVCGREYDNQTYKIFCYEYIEEYDDKDKEIERLNNELKEFKEEHNIMKQILIEKNLWETLLNDDRFLKYLRK